VDLTYGEKYEAFRQAVRDFLERNRERAPRAATRGGDQGQAAKDWQKLLIEHGYAARTIPREYGGYGAEADLLETIILDEEFARARVSRGMGGQGISMLVPTLLEHGSEEQKRDLVPPTVSGEILWCQGYSEPGAGSDLASLQTHAVEDGDDFLIRGQKIWTSTAKQAQMMFALVRTELAEPRHAGISYLVFPMSTPGIEVSPLKTMTGNAEFNQVFFNDVRVPKTSVVGKRGEGWKIGNTTLRHERNMLGSAEGSATIFRTLVDLMKSETLDGSRAIDDPILCDRLVKLQAKSLAMKYHSLRMLTSGLRAESPGVAGLTTKLNGCQLNHDLAELAIDSMGELGTLYDKSKYERAGGYWQFQYMFSLGLIIGGGTAQIQKNIISERGLGMPREPRGDASRSEGSN
jgi:alkylation response protein AidB-like acyl-CoA dehydrogenase